MEDLSIIDEVSGLVISPLSDEMIRKLASYDDEETPKELRERMLKSLKKEGIKYFVRTNSKDIECMSGKGFYSTPGEYYDVYEDALEAVAEDLYINVLGVDNERHVAKSHLDECECGVKIKYKYIPDNKVTYFTCYECAFL